MTVDIQKMRTLLLVKREELIHNIVSLMETDQRAVVSDKASEGPQELEDIAADTLEMQRELSILINEQALLQEVEDALKRIEDGTYGRCVVCGQPIPEERLEAVPWAARCMKDEEQPERGNLMREDLSNSDLP